MKQRIYFNEFNVRMADVVYLPLVSGLLRARVESQADLASHFQFMPFLHVAQPPAAILSGYESPAVAAFSICMWNEQLSLRIAEAVKERWPECLIVFGGPQAPHGPADYFREHRFIDVMVRGEGEDAFCEVLERSLTGREFGGIAGIAWRDPATGACVRNDAERPLPDDLDTLPSPYLAGHYEYLFAENPDTNFQAIIETNRGCPFSCAYCYWGQGGLSKKLRLYSLERVRAELEWCAQHKIRYIFNADGNFGIHPRDIEIAEILVDLKKRYGYPEKFRSCFTKNTKETTYRLAMRLHEEGLEKAITLARQSNNPQVIVNVGRKNISMRDFTAFQQRFNAAGVPVYSEMILGLPGETYESWCEGIEELIESGLANFLVYFCQVYPNTRMSDPDYARKFGVRTRRILLTEIHGAVRPADSVPEYEDIVVATDAMPEEDLRKATVFSWMTMALHSMKLGVFVLHWLSDRFGLRAVDFLRWIVEERMPAGVGGLLREEVAHYRQRMDELLSGLGRGRIMPEFGGVYWNEEEATILRASRDLDEFYRQLAEVVAAYLSRQGAAYDAQELAEVIAYQRMRMPAARLPAACDRHFEWNFPEYFAKRGSAAPVALARRAQVLRVLPKNFEGDRVAFAREVAIWGRLSGRLLNEARWERAEASLAAEEKQ